MAEFLDNVRLSPDGTSVILLDQSLLPGRVEERQVRSLDEMVEAIRALRVRGAPAIGIFAGYCLYVLAGQLERQGLTGADFFKELERQGKILAAARPTAVNLAWAVDRLSRRAASIAGASVSEIVRTLGEEARAIHREDMEMCEAISRYGLSLLKEGDGVLTLSLIHISPHGGAAARP